MLGITSLSFLHLGGDDWHRCALGGRDPHTPGLRVMKGGKSHHQRTKRNHAVVRSGQDKAAPTSEKGHSTRAWMSDLMMLKSTPTPLQFSPLFSVTHSGIL